jgi:hypothetical protein
VFGQYGFMAQNWTLKVARKAAGIFRALPRGSYGNEHDADARRIRVELDAIRARFPDHA